MQVARIENKMLNWALQDWELQVQNLAKMNKFCMRRLLVDSIVSHRTCFKHACGLRSSKLA